MIVSNRWLYQGADQKPHSNNISKHRDCTQAMSNQGDEVHPRLSGDPVSAWNRNQFERQSRPKNRSGVMVPLLGTVTIVLRCARGRILKFPTRTLMPLKTRCKAL